MQKKAKRIIHILLAVVLVSGCFTGAILARADDAIPIDAEHFPDAGWRQIVQTYYDKDEEGAEGYGSLSAEERNVTIMSIPGMRDEVLGEDVPVPSIQGIEYFTSLKTLRCGGIGLTALDVSALQDLNVLTCEGNELTELTVQNNVYLKELNCSDNELRTLSLSYNVNLQKLLCENNLLTELKTAPLSKLTYLKCSDNALSALDLSANTQLTTLICSGNQLAALDLSANTALLSKASDAVSIGGQTVTAPATQADNVFYTAISLDGNRLKYQQTDSYENGSFVTTDYALMQNGFQYEYDTGNSQVDLLDVSVLPQKNFYLIQFYTDESKSTLIAANAVNAGETAAAPEWTLPQCKTLDHWSDSLENITADKTVYAVYKDAHAIAVTAFTEDGYATIACKNCGGEARTVCFADSLAAKTGDSNYEPYLDVNQDGYVNARDYVLLDKQFR